MSASISKNLIPWQQQHGRNNLPWQSNPTPYRVWISEIMLQQTQVETVKAYYLRFMHCFPTIEDLARASEDEVLQLWTGLGYYARARHLHRAAKIIVNDYQGKFPETLSEMIKLPGIGRSTAGAILSFAMNQSAVILDGNVKRVLSRVFAMNIWPGDPKLQNELWDIATKYTPKINAGIYNQALMDLGAMICTRRAPKCPLCPLRNVCLAYEKNLQEKIPQSKPKKTLPEKHAYMLVLHNKKQNAILLVKRKAPGIWGGLWCFPECPTKLRNKKDYIETSSHTFTHYRFHIQLVKISTQSLRIPNELKDAEYQWYKLDNSNPLALAAPVKKIFEST
ncbi:MAG: A/G-specific adenine glycosylase [Gammaproteobacteria bacterium]|jgi:A/G-specific adenine glycosylase